MEKTNQQPETATESVRVTETQTTKTIGEVAEKRAREYFNLFKYFKKEHPELNAENLAKHDLVQEKLINEFALEKLERLIKGEAKE
jgi:hypothetical protein